MVPQKNLSSQSLLRSDPRSRFYPKIKRALDLFFALILLPLLLPLMAFIALLIKLESRGPILFKQKRTGKNESVFWCLKFRTMVPNAERLLKDLLALNEMEGPTFKMKNDPRITKVGKFLRRYSLDELPQIFNILKGEMSFVGPRPSLPEEVEKYEPWHKQRLSVTPGLTCLWQISGRNTITKFDDWVRMDLEYIESMSFTQDFKIVLKTFPAVFSHRGAY